MNKQKMVLTARQILFHLIDAFVVGLDIFDGYRRYRKPISDYYQWRDIDKARFQQSLYKLKRAKFIKTYKKEKERYIELAPRGREKIKKIILTNLEINIPENWDYKWYIVVFDIPEEKKKIRDIISSKLIQIGFYRLQKSVFVFPFDCKKEIDRIKSLYQLEPHIQYIKAEEIETEINLTEYFFKKKVIKNIVLNGK